MLRSCKILDSARISWRDKVILAYNTLNGEYITWLYSNGTLNNEKHYKEYEDAKISMLDIAKEKVPLE